MAPIQTPIQKIVFDLDGTLVDSLAITFKAFNFAIENNGGQALSWDKLSTYFGPGEPVIFGKILGCPEKALVATENFYQFMQENIHKAPFHEGIDDLLAALEEKKFPMSIFTGRSRSTTDMILAHNKMASRFQMIVTNDEVEHPKPSPEGLYKIAEQTGIPTSAMLFVGDHSADMIAARSAGSQGVAALWDRTANEDSLRAWSPSFWARKPKDILDIFSTSLK